MILLRIILFLIDAIKQFLHKNCQYMAAAISFYALFSMFPLGLAVISILGFIIGTESSNETLAKDIANVLPISSDLIGSTMEGIISARAITGIASFVGLVWTSSAAFSAVRKGINTAWGVTTPRAFVWERIIDIGLVFAAGLLVLIILFTAPLIEIIRQIFEYNLPQNEIPADMIWGTIADLVSPILAFISILVLYRWLPNTKVRIIHVVPGALLASICFILAQLGFIWYVGKFPVYNILYGAVGAIMALLAWVYISALIILFGAQITSMFHEYSTSSSKKSGILSFWTGFTRVRVKIVNVSSND